MAISERGAQTPSSGAELPARDLLARGASVGVAWATAAALAVFSPFLGIVGAGLAPLASDIITRHYERRAARAAQLLGQKGIDLNLVIESAPDQTRGPIVDLCREYLAASLDSDSEEKIRFLVYLLESGLVSESKLEILFAKRVVRTIARIDELEMILLACLSRMDRNLTGVRVAELMKESAISDANVVRSGLAVLASEGLIRDGDEHTDTFRVSDYGEKLLKELRSSVKGEAIPPI